MRSILFSVLVGAALAGCGIKGPLYLPPQQTIKPVSKPETAPTAPNAPDNSKVVQPPTTPLP